MAVMTKASGSDPQGGRAKGQDNARHWQSLRRLLPCLWPQEARHLRSRVVAALTALVLAKTATICAPFLYKEVVDQLTLEGKNSLEMIAVVPVFLVVAYGVARVLMIVLGQLRDGLFARVGQNAVRVVALKTFQHIHTLSLRFHLERYTGDLSQVINRGTKAVDFLLRFTLFSIIPTVIELVLVCAVLAWHFDWRYAAVTGGTVVIYIWLTFMLTEWRTRFRKQMNEHDGEASAQAVDSLLNFETVKYFCNEEREAARFDQSMARYEEAAVRTTTSLSLLNSVQALVFSSGLVVVMMLAGYGVADETLTVGDFVMVNAFLIQLSQPLNLLGSIYREIRQSLIDTDTMFGVLDRVPEISDMPDAPALTVQGGDITFENVSFAYDSGRSILDNVSFRVPAGKKVAIVGPTGAGKSTISRILYRFYDVQQGRVKIDAQDIAKVQQQSLRAAVGIIPQDTVLFNDTIRYNIHYGKPGASDAEIKEVLRLAQMSDFIARLPEGLDTRVGERGLKLSGGEKQRVAIARTLLKNPPILLLDEATSSLDAHTEREIQAALEQVSRNRTTLIITHRLSIVEDADEILLLEAGRIVERGRHESLLSEDGKYAALWHAQQRKPAELPAGPS